MSRWTIKKSWYSRKQWIMRRIISSLLVVTMFFGPGFPIAAFAAGPDNFVGDAGIYAGTPDERVRPKVLRGWLGWVAALTEMRSDFRARRWCVDTMI